MIPDKKKIFEVWKTYSLPESKQRHVLLVARVALYFAKQIQKSINTPINIPLLEASALLHDIDKAVVRLPGEQHPDTAVRILRTLGMDEVAAIVATHSVHAILDPEVSPKTWEEKILFLADKMVKYEIMDVDRRFALWRDEQLPDKAQKVLDSCYPLVKRLEAEVCSLIHVSPAEVENLA